MIRSATWLVLIVLIFAACAMLSSMGCTHDQADAARGAIDSPAVRGAAATIPFGETILGAISLGLAAWAEYQRRRARRNANIAAEIVQSVEPVLTEAAKDSISQSEMTRQFVRAVKSRLHRRSL